MSEVYTYRFKISDNKSSRTANELRGNRKGKENIKY